MRVATEDLPRHSGEVTMVDGGFDPIHAGHVEYFRAAAELGAPVLCNISGDDWVSRKHTPFLPHEERAAVIDAFRDISFTHVSHTPTVEVLRLLRPRFYAKGADWRDRLPEEERRTCEEAGIELVFLDTVTNSSTLLLREYERRAQETSASERTSE
jgi:cytidyltransferase-like protein